MFTLKLLLRSLILKLVFSSLTQFQWQKDNYLSIMKKIKWILILLVLAVIGSFLPENEPEGISYSASSEETNDWEEDDLEESQGGEKEAMRFSEDSRTNRNIVNYNEQNSIKYEIICQVISSDDDFLYLKNVQKSTNQDVDL